MSKKKTRRAIALTRRQFDLLDWALRVAEENTTEEWMLDTADWRLFSNREDFTSLRKYLNLCMNGAPPSAGGLDGDRAGGGDDDESGATEG